MLKQRVITALLLMLVLLPALFYPDPAPFSLLALLFMAAATWEWARNTQAPSSTCLLYTSPSPRDRQKSRMPSSA